MEYGALRMAARIIIGLMSGTSVDAIDAAIVEITGRSPQLKARLLWHSQTTWPSELRRRLLAAMAPAKVSTEEICAINFLVAKRFAVAAQNALRGCKLRHSAVTAIACHGQTICHLPPRSHGDSGSTLQIGDTSVIATLTGIPTIGDFRSADMALSGQGAPLVPWTDAILLRQRHKVRAIQNIGGIANVTYLPRGVGIAGVIAFDTGPGNMALDALISAATGGRARCDRGGRIARMGQVQPQLLRRLQNHRYFSVRPPKSTGREEFGMRFVETLLGNFNGIAVCDAAATLTRLTAWSIAEAYRNFLPHIPDEAVICGGGLANPELMRLLRHDLGEIGCRVVTPIDELGLPNKAREAMAFALLGAATLDRVAANLPAVTGALRPTVLGHIAWPK